MSKAVVSRADAGQQHEKTKGINHLFVIAIDTYEYCPRLYNCVKDAKGLIKILTEQYEFEQQNIRKLFNEEATEGNIFQAFRTLITQVKEIDNVIIYFSGHGEYDQVFDEGYWIPVNAKLGAHEDFVPNSKIKNILEAIKSKHTFLIADSCFSGSLFTRFKSAAVAERLENDPSRWGLTAGRNEVVSDGQDGDHSPFADSLLYHLKENKVPLGVATLCNRVIENVVAAAEQTPRGEPLKVKGHRGGQFFFHPRNFIENKVTKESGKGGILYQIPNQMKLEEDTKCVVRIAFNAATLKRELAITEDTEIKSIKVSQLMEVELFDPLTEGNFQIRAINEQEQLLDKTDFTQWIFYVKAKKVGKFPLFLKVTVIELIYGKERKKEIVLEETVHVITQLIQPRSIVFKDAGYVVALAPATVKGMDLGTTAAVKPFEQEDKGGQQGSRTELIPPPAPIPPPIIPIDNKKTKGKLYKVLGGIAAALIFLVIGNSVLNTDSSSSPDFNPKPVPTSPVEVPIPKGNELSQRNLRKAYNPNGNGKVGFKDADSKELAIDYLYDGAINFNGPSTFVKVGNKWALIDKKGDFIIKFKIKQPSRFRNGVAEIIPEGLNRVVKINHKGEVAVKGKFYKLEDYLKRRN